MSFGLDEGGEDGFHGEESSATTSAPQLMEVLGDDALAVVLDHLTRGGGADPADIARVSCVSRRMRALALEQMQRMRVLDLTKLSRRARWAAPHLARRCESLTTILCDGTNVTDENVTALLAASEGTLQRLSLADCRHLRNLHTHVFGQQQQQQQQQLIPPSCAAWCSSSSSPSPRLAQVNLRGSSWSTASLTALLRSSRHTLTALNLSSTCVKNLTKEDDFGDVARCILECRRLKRLHLGAPVDFVPACLAKNIFSELRRSNGGRGGGGGGRGGGSRGGHGVDPAAAAASTSTTTTATNSTSISSSRNNNNNNRISLRATISIDDPNFQGEVADRPQPPYFSELEELSLARNGAADDNMLDDIALHCPLLRQLDLRGSSVTRAGVVSFASTARCGSRLRSLLLGGCESLDDAALTAVSRGFSMLEELDLSMHHQVGPEGIAALAGGCLHLRRLCISRNARVTTECLAYLARGESMRSLTAVKCRRAGEPALRRLRRELEEDGGVREGGGEDGDDEIFQGTGGGAMTRRSTSCRVDWVGDDFAGWDLY